MIPNASITGRLIFVVLLLEFMAAIVLIAIVGNHERHIQFTVFKTNLRASASGLFGALQEADARDGSIVLDLSGLSIPSNAVYSVADAGGRVLGAQGRVPTLSPASGSFTEAKVGTESYLFYVLMGERAIDPGKPFAVYHHVRITYGLPVRRVWHEVLEAIRFFAFATLVLLGMTALLLTWFIRRFLLPIRQLAAAADGIDTDSWIFTAPPESKRFSELRPLASAIEETIVRLQRSFEQQRRFTSNAAHELKTDLAIVKSSLQVLSMKRRTAEEYEHGLSLCLEDIVRLETTVQKMLTLARLEQSPKNDNQACNITEAVLDAVAQSQPFAAFRQVKVKQSIPGAGAMVAISNDDAVLLCSNILMNALQHSPPDRTVEVTMSCNPESVCLMVRDHGAGVIEEDQPFVFDAFYRGDASRSRKTGGTGLGLSICRAICSRAGGSISITNHIEGGASVEIRLPATSRDHAPA